MNNNLEHCMKSGSRALPLRRMRGGGSIWVKPGGVRVTGPWWNRYHVTELGVSTRLQPHAWQQTTDPWNELKSFRNKWKKWQTDDSSDILPVDVFFFPLFFCCFFFTSKDTEESARWKMCTGKMSCAIKGQQSQDNGEMWSWPHRFPTANIRWILNVKLLTKPWQWFLLEKNRKHMSQ